MRTRDTGHACAAHSHSPCQLRTHTLTIIPLSPMTHGAHAWTPLSFGKETPTNFGLNSFPPFPYGRATAYGCHHHHPTRIICRILAVAVEPNLFSCIWDPAAHLSFSHL
mmetsp:Transcript_32026/g.97703  ORF Transcript_32026/g.97703 Transcript_32026/m.97703 type:complete len:109 (+) Transcript_32026:67-393(+)